MHFCKNFFIRDRLELSNERLSQNLENLYKKKKFAATRIHFRVTNHETYLIIALPRYFKILVTIQDYVLDVDGCFGVRVCVCVCVFFCLCAKIRISDSNQQIYIKERKRRQALWTLWDLRNREAFGNGFCVLFLLPVNIYWVTSMSYSKMTYRV